MSGSVFYICTIVLLCSYFAYPVNGVSNQEATIVPKDPEEPTSGFTSDPAYDDNHEESDDGKESIPRIHKSFQIIDENEDDEDVKVAVGERFIWT